MYFSSFDSFLCFSVSASQKLEQWRIWLKKYVQLKQFCHLKNPAMKTIIPLSIIKTYRIGTQMENEIYMFVSAFLLVATARTKIDIIKSYYTSFLASKLDQVRWGERGRKWGVSGHGQPASLCYSLGRNSRQWGRAMLQYIYTSPFPLTQASRSRRSLGINTDIRGAE